MFFTEFKVLTNIFEQITILEPWLRPTFAQNDEIRRISLVSMFLILIFFLRNSTNFDFCFSVQMSEWRCNLLISYLIWRRTCIIIMVSLNFFQGNFGNVKWKFQNWYRFCGIAFHFIPHRYINYIMRLPLLENMITWCNISISDYRSFILPF